MNQRLFRLTVAHAFILNILSGLLPVVNLSSAETVELGRREPPVFTLSELVGLINKAGKQGIYVDPRLADKKVWIVQSHTGIDVDRLMKMMAEATGLTRRRVGDLQILVESERGYAENLSQLSDALQKDQSTVRAGMLKRAAHLWDQQSPFPPEDGIHEKSWIPWGSAPEAWQQVIRKGLRAKAEQSNDAPLAKFLWAPRGMSEASVHFSLAAMAIVATPPSFHPPGYYWGILTEGIAVESK